MEKKQYTKPAMRVYELKRKAALLLASNVDIYGDMTTNQI